MFTECIKRLLQSNHIKVKKETGHVFYMTIPSHTTESAQPIIIV